MKNSKIVKLTAGLFLVTILSKIMGFLREMVLVGIYGADIVSDVYITTMNIPTVIFSIIGAALSTTFIPLFFEIEKNDGPERALKFSNNIFNIVIALSLILSIFCYIFAEPIVKIFAIEFTGYKLVLAIQFTKIIGFSMIFIGISSIMSCWLNIKGNFNIPGLVGLPYNIIIIISIILSININILVLPIGLLLATLSQFLFQVPFAYKEGYRYKSYINFKDKYLKKLIYLILPVIIGVGVGQINTVVDRSLASTLGDGFITILNSANRLNDFVQGLFIVTITTVMYPLLSNLSSIGKDEEFKDNIKKCINMLIILIIPVSIGAIILSEPVVKVVFERGKFDSVATKMTSIALSYYSIGMIGLALKSMLDKVFYSLKDTKTPMINGALAMGINILLNLTLINFMGYKGLALATSISFIICVILLFRKLKYKIGYFGQDEIIKTLVKCTIASGLMGIVVYFMYKFIELNFHLNKIQEAISLFTFIFIGALIYALSIKFMKIEEVDILIEIFKSKLKKFKI